MITNSLVENFARDGYLLLDNVFDAGLMRCLETHILGHFGDNPAFLHSDEFLEKAQTDVIPWFPQQDDQGGAGNDFDQVQTHKQLGQLTSALLGKNWQQLNCMVMFSKQGTQGQAWHQDCAPEDASRYNLNRLVYTSDINAETGGQIVVVPGSHRRGLLPAGNPWADFEDQRILCPTAGALVLLHGHLWHRVLPIHNNHRYSVNYRAAPAGTPADITDVCVYRNMRYRFSTESVIEDRMA